MRSLFDRLANAVRHPIAALDEERDRWFLWTPVLVGVGIALYFALNVEPWTWTGSLVVLVLLILNWVAFIRLKRSGRGNLPLILMVLSLIALGFAAAQLRTSLVDAPALSRELGPVRVAGTVDEVDVFASGARLTLENATISGLDGAETPNRIRLRLRGETPLPRPGDRVSLIAVLEPLGAPTTPGGFDFQRYGFFQRLGAVGFVIGGMRIEDRQDSGLLNAGFWFQSLRMTIGERVRLNHDDAAGAVVTALLVGETTGIPMQTLNAVRDAGLAHLLSISGVHIGMVAGVLFFWMRLLVAAIPSLALRVDSKKIAAIVAIAGATFYALISGNSVPTQRSLLMLTVVMIGVLVSRRALSMRLLGWAALIILLTQPEAMLGASFQMSFAAMVALIAASERSKTAKQNPPPNQPRSLRQTFAYILAIVATSVVATLATAPFAVYHFNRLALIGVLSNIIAIPLTGFWILPWGMLALLLMPFGFDDLALTPMAWGTGLLIRLAEFAASAPGAAVSLPLLPDSGLALIAIGGLWLCLWQTSWRLVGLIGIAAGIASMVLVVPPNILIDGQGTLMGVRLSNGTIALSSASSSHRSRRNWSQRNGQEASSPVWPKVGSLDDGHLRCDRLGCTLIVSARTVAFPRLAIARADDCRDASLVISADPFPQPCPSATRVVDRGDLLRGGAHAIWIGPSTIRIKTVNAERGRRPWVKTNDIGEASDDEP
jgi:ComEC/Rec2-related protein